MPLKSGKEPYSVLGVYPVAVRSRFRIFLALAFTSALGLYLYSYSHRPIPHELARQPVGGVKQSLNWTDDLSQADSPVLPQTGAPIAADAVGAGLPDLINTYTPEELMNLPVLHHTFEDPFDPRNGFRPLRDSHSPWLATSHNGVLLTNKLSRNRFPPANSIDSSRGSSPPPIPIWPSHKLLREKEESLKAPIPKHLIAGLNTSYVWEGRERIKEGNVPKIQWPGFDKPHWETDSDRINRLERQGWVRRGFQHVWEGYKARAWGHDELRPVSGWFEDPFGGWGATLVDCLDTLLIMNLTLEYNYARTHVKAIDWGQIVGEVRGLGYSLSNNPKVSLFETVIRYLGGLLSAYDLSGDKLMLERAEELAEWLLPAFGTSSGVPQTQYEIGSNPLGGNVGRVVTSDIGSLTLEFTRLSQLTSKGFYFDVAHKIIDILDSEQWLSPSRLGTLFPTVIDPDSASMVDANYTFGAMVDSYYEYLIKQHQLLRGTHLQYSRMYTSALNSARTYLIKTYEIESAGGKNLTVIGDSQLGNFRPSLDHLTCFAGATIGLGAQLLHKKEDLNLAMRHTDACVWAYESTKTGVGPDEIFLVDNNDPARWQPVLYKGKKFRELKPEPVQGATLRNPSYLGRPETIEQDKFSSKLLKFYSFQMNFNAKTLKFFYRSVYYMWRITGDQQWQDRGWRMFTSWMEACVTEFGFANLEDVNAWPPMRFDRQQSFVLAETFKYYYLLFSDPDLVSLDDYVFNTEAHPLRIDIPEKPLKTYWNKSDESLDNIFDPPGLEKGKHGYGTFLQQWAQVDLAKLSQEEHQVYNRVMGIERT
ncbi:hypothetical protein PTTG_29514 [Puccinia triticina 1-1 BBBD Race 1]|uniref:alpha-1,2-Mannosidase n=1 Tax=Puccinia triticina (isolate 1-1 / race 1 (BBBD)) TaxID=630390 RepID=A0A180G3S8_PUCT1|nr:hypothetical protein PTTG_29514 [Puccinia triticina 1-1 BBBD Race 1]